MQSILPQQILNRYLSLPPLPPHPIKINNNTLRQKHSGDQLCRVFFGFAIFLASHSASCSAPFVVMVTASHNPPQYNGLKFSVIGQQLPFSCEDIEAIINHQSHFEKLINNTKFQTSFKRFDCIIGRDTRPTSQMLTQLIKQGFQLLGKQVLDLGERSTPETFSMEYLYSRMIRESIQFGPSLIRDYYDQIESCFRGAIELIQSNNNRKWQRKRLCLDFANGVGAVSFSHYSFLNEYFELVVVNSTEFHQPNVNCGAQWIFINKFNLSVSNGYPEVQETFFFDGDCDRIIGKFKEQPFLIDGDDLNACFSLFLRELLKKSGISKNIKMVSVSNVVSNRGIEQYLNTIGLQLELVPVGMKNLFNRAIDHDVCSYYENNGHGCIYFSPNLIDDLTRQSSWQAQLLLCLHKLSRNNTRGYALHNMLMLELYLYYFKVTTAKLFQKQHVIELTYDLKIAQIFCNSNEGKKLLVQPKQIVKGLQQIQKQFSNCDMTVRKSDTTPLLRVTIQGQFYCCQNMKVKIDQFLKSSLSKIHN